MKSNIYIARVWNSSLKNQQALDYVALCRASLSRECIGGYTEKHHMLPKSICTTREEILDRDNLVTLSAKEHFIAHKLLSEMFDGRIKRKMQKALSMMLADRLGNRIFTSEEYEIARIANSESKKGIKLPPRTREHSENHSKSLRGHIRSKESCEKQSKTTKGRPLTDRQIAEYEGRIGNWISPMSGKQHSDASKEKMSKSGKGNVKSENHRKNIGISLTGRQFSEEHIRNLSGPKSITECPHCGKIGGVNNMSRWHFNNCKKVRYV